MEWYSNGKVYLTKPSIGQCKKVISKLKENNHHWVVLRNSTSYIVQFLLPQLLKEKTITVITISLTKVTKDDIISLQLPNNTTLEALWITDGSTNDDGVITLVQSLKYNKSITTLDLHNNPDITSTSAQSLAELLLNNLTLKDLILNNTNIDAKGVPVLAESLVNNKALRILCLGRQLAQTFYSLPYYQTIKDRLGFV